MIGTFNSSRKTITRIRINKRSVIARQVRKKDERNDRKRRCEKTNIVVVLPIRPVKAMAI